MKVNQAAEEMSQNGDKNDREYWRGEADVHYQEFRNEDWKEFDKEYGKLLKYRKEIVNSKWGKEMKARIEVVRKSKEFKNLEADWKKQVYTKMHLETVQKWKELLEETENRFKITGEPDDFQEGHFIKQAIKLLDIINEIVVEGEIKGFFDYLLDYD